MTKKEAKDFLYKKMRNYSEKIEINKELVDLIEVNELIDQIYNDFENRTCQNCRYFQINIEGEKICLNHYMKRYGNWFETEESFGCNKFERKIDEQNNQEDC